MLDRHPSLKMKGKVSIAAMLREQLCALLHQCDQAADYPATAAHAVTFG
jgi:hypothetical protein